MRSANFGTDSSPRCGGCLFGSSQISAIVAAQQTAANTYAPVMVNPQIRPPNMGPTTEAISKIVLFHVTALGKMEAGTSWGINADRAGRPNVAPALPRIIR